MVFRLDDGKHFDDLQARFLPEIGHHCPHASIIFVGTVSSDIDDHIAAEMGSRMKSQVEALPDLSGNGHKLNHFSFVVCPLDSEGADRLSTELEAVGHEWANQAAEEKYFTAADEEREAA